MKSCPDRPSASLWRPVFRNHMVNPVLRVGLILGAIAIAVAGTGAAMAADDGKPPPAPGNGDVGGAANDSGGLQLPSELVVPDIIAAAFTGDLDEIRQRGTLRVLVTPNRTDFFLRGGTPHGMIPEMLNEYTRYLNKGRGRKEMHTDIKFVMAPFNRLIPDLIAGRGDVIATLMTITPLREELVRFVAPRTRAVDELVVVHADAPRITTLADLSGRDVRVVRGSSYAEHLRRLNEEFKNAGRSPVNILEVPAYLDSGDLLELVNSGAFEITVADDFRVRLWQKVLPNIRVLSDVIVNQGGYVGLAIRKENPLAGDNLDDFTKSLRRGTALGNTLFKRYYENTKWIKNPLADSERAKFDEVVGLFKRYGDRYSLDYLAILAQAYQESGLDQSVRSPAGALGIMQLLPSTAADPQVAIADIDQLENNVHAGTKYMAFLRDRYFSDGALKPEDRLAFTWAAYNAGPRRVSQMRARAKELGLDPDRWFGNVEYAALGIVGQETVRYVGNIFKYYVAYHSVAAFGRQRGTDLETL